MNINGLPGIGKEKINGYTFCCTEKRLRNTDNSFNIGKLSLSEEFFTEKLIEELDEDTGIYKAKNGMTVLRIYESIPTFDSSDRIYNSYRVLLIFNHNGKRTGILLRGGYRLAEATLCIGMVCADEKTKQIVDESLNIYSDENT